MFKTIVLEQALILPSIDIAAMLEGQLIVAMPQVQIANGLSFLLSPEESSLEIDPTLKYRVPFLALPEMGCGQDGMIQVKAWATCEKTTMVHDRDHLASISSLTVWNRSYLEKLFDQRQYLFLSYLRVHRLSNLVSFPKEKIPFGKSGKFVGLSVVGCQPTSVKEPSPILSDRLFSQRKEKLETRKTWDNSRLEELQAEIANYIQINPEAKALDHDIKIFLGWVDLDIRPSEIPTWVREITTSGNSSDGNLFEQRVRQAFIELGFTNTLNNIKASLDPNATGGAGGIDIYCEKPYPIVGECKASKNESVPNGVSAQLIHLGNTHLGKNQFDASIKIIFASGKLTDHAEKAAIENKMNVMRPETLQRLVELKTTHPGAIDLLKLKPCLENAPFGTDADKKVNEFIDNICNQLQVRSLIVQTVQTLQSDNEKNITATVVRIHFNATAKIDHRLDSESITHSLLLELSSPLTGYLGRTKGTTWKDDRFYFLRDLIV